MTVEEAVAGESRGSEPWVVTKRWAWLSRFFEEVNMSKPNASLTLVIHPENASSRELVKFRMRLGSAPADLGFTPLLQRPRDEFDHLKESIESDTSDEDQKQEQQGNGRQGAVNPSIIRAERINVRRRYMGFHNNFLGELFAEHADIQVHIRQSEELAFIDFLIFLYKPDCSKNYQEHRLLDILKMAARFRGFEACSMSLMNHHPKDNVIKYLELGKKLPPSLNERMEPLAENFIVNYFQDIASTYYELVKQPLSVIKLVLSSDKVRVSTEDKIYDLVLDWTKYNYPDNLSMRRSMLNTEFFHLIRFCHLSLRKLVQVAEKRDLDHDLIHEAVYEAWFAKTRVPYSRCIDWDHKICRERIYDVPVELKVYGPPDEFCSVTMRVTDDEYNRVASRAGEKIGTQPIPFVRRTMAVEISSRNVSSSRPNKRIRDQEKFAVALRVMKGDDFPFKLKYEIALRPANLNGEFAVMFRGNCWFGRARTQYVGTLGGRHSDLRVDLYRVP